MQQNILKQIITKKKTNLISTSFQNDNLINRSIELTWKVN